MNSQMKLKGQQKLNYIKNLALSLLDLGDALDVCELSLRLKHVNCLNTYIS